MLWRRTFELLRCYPILWIPYIIALLAAVTLWRLRGMAERSILRWFSTTHSVIVGDISTPSMDKAALTKASVVYLPIGFCTIILIVFLFAAALLATNEIVKMIERGETPDLRAAVSILRWKNALVLSIKFLLMFVILTVFSICVATFPSPAAHYSRLANSRILRDILVVATASFTVWWITPAAIRVLREQPDFRVSAERRLQALLFAAITTSLGMALGVVAQKAEAHVLLDSRWQLDVLTAFNSLVADAPDVFLFIALALLAMGDKQEEERRPALREFLQALMPLHFQNNKEQR